MRRDVTDRIEDTVDYGQVCEMANLVAQQRTYKTLERLCAAIADRLLEQYDAGAVWVKAAKPEPPLALPVGEVSVEVWREAGVDARVGYLGLGSNLGDRRSHLRGRRAGAARPRRRGAGLLVASMTPSRSAWSSTSPSSSTPACGSRPRLDPEELLDAGKAVEREVGRAAGGLRHGPRVIDVDVLLLGSLTLQLRAAAPAPRRGALAALRARAAARARPGAHAARRRPARRRAWTRSAPGQEVRRAGPPLL